MEGEPLDYARERTEPFLYDMCWEENSHDMVFSMAVPCSIAGGR
jgi:hypothetical protein